jgi:hypothetical protein
MCILFPLAFCLLQEKKPVSGLMAVEGWKALLGVVDGGVVAFHLQTLKPLGQVCVGLCV